MIYIKVSQMLVSCNISYVKENTICNITSIMSQIEIFGFLCLHIRIHFKGGQNLQNAEHISQQTGHSVLFLKRNWCYEKT